MSCPAARLLNQQQGMIAVGSNMPSIECQLYHPLLRQGLRKAYGLLQITRVVPFQTSLGGFSQKNEPPPSTPRTPFCIVPSHGHNRALKKKWWWYPRD
jgi:hypothetical protein